MIYLKNSKNIKYNTIDIFSYIEIRNINNYDFCDKSFDDWLITYNNNHNDNDNDTISDDINYIFIIDNIFNDAFAHFVYQSAIYLPLYNILKKKYNNIKLALKCKKTYKSLFINFFDINNDDIIYYIPNNNICFFPMPSSLNIKHYNENYSNSINNFFNIFNNTILYNTIEYEYLIMPRQSKENYKYNDCYVSYNNIINKFNNNYNKKYFILNTDNITNLKDQIKIIQSSKNIIITDGSPYLVNGLFCKNKIIHLCGRLITNSQRTSYPYVDIICKNIEQYNNIIQYNNEDEFILKNLNIFI
jgi:hypothetical protein